MQWNWRPVAGVALLILGAAGCGSGERLASVSGSVTFEGQPIQNGYIVFEPTGGTGRPAGIAIVGGRYSLGVAPGAHRVLITAFRPGGEVNYLGGPTQKQFLPEQYNAKSKLTAQVAEGKSGQFDFALTSR
jgi:hypothetical protein